MSAWLFLIKGAKYGSASASVRTALTFGSALKVGLIKARNPKRPVEESSLRKRACGHTIVPFKRPVYERLMVEFERFAKPID